MKNIFGIALVLGFMTVMPLPTSAFSILAESGVNIRAENRMDINALKQNEERPALLRANAEARAEVRAEARKEWSEEHSTSTEARMKAHAHWMTKRFAVVIERLEILADRIESRIEKMNDEEVDTTVAAEFVADARIHLDQASEGFVDLSAKLDTMIETKSWSKEVFQELRTLASEIKADIKGAHQDLMNAVRSLKGEATVNVDASAKSNIEVQ